MKKTKSLFQRNYDGDRQVRNEVVSGSEWVLAGEGYATRKYDGMAVKIENDMLFKRYDAKPGRKPPSDFVPCQPEPDPETGHWPGWVELKGKELVRVANAIPKNIRTLPGSSWAVADGTFEFCGPTVGTRHGPNPENLTEHILVRHGEVMLVNCPRTFSELKDYFAKTNIEGIVWYHPDGRMVKIKAMDFGISRSH